MVVSLPFLGHREASYADGDLDLHDDFLSELVSLIYRFEVSYLSLNNAFIQSPIHDTVDGGFDVDVW